MKHFIFTTKRWGYKWRHASAGAPQALQGCYTSVLHCRGVGSARLLDREQEDAHVAHCRWALHVGAAPMCSKPR